MEDRYLRLYTSVFSDYTDDTEWSFNHGQTNQNESEEISVLWQTKFFFNCATPSCHLNCWLLRPILLLHFIIMMRECGYCYSFASELRGGCVLLCRHWLYLWQCIPSSTISLRTKIWMAIMTNPSGIWHLFRFPLRSIWGLIGINLLKYSQVFSYQGPNNSSLSPKLHQPYKYIMLFYT